MHYTFDEFGRFSGVSDVQTSRSTDIEPPALAADYNWSGHDWVHAPGLPTTTVAVHVVVQDPAPVQHSRQITRAAFLRRFTDAEAIAIDLASIGPTVEAAGIRRYLSLVNAAAYVDLDDPATRAGVTALEAGQLIGTGRAPEIIDTPVAPAERP